MTIPTPRVALVVPPPPAPKAQKLTPDQQIDAEAANDAAFFARGNQMFVAETNSLLVQPYLGAAMMAIAYENGVGVFAQLAYAVGHDGPQFVFVPFARDKTTVFKRLPKGAYQYPVAEADSPVTDLSDTPIMGAGRRNVRVHEFFPPFADDLERMAEEAAQKAEEAERARAAAAAAPKPDYSGRFSPGTIFVADSTKDVRLRPYVGIPMQSIATKPHRVLAVPAKGNELNEPSIWLPLDGPQTDWSLNPGGKFRFANGVAAGNNVWNVETQTYVSTRTVVPAYVPPVVIAYDPWEIPLGVAAGIFLADAILEPPYLDWVPGIYTPCPYW